MKNLIKEDVGLPAIYDSLARALDLRTEAARQAFYVMINNLKLLDNKQLDYGPANISGFGTFGVVVRMNDKFERLKTLMAKKRRKPVNESLHDTFQDIANYAVIATLVDTQKWPTV